MKTRTKIPMRQCTGCREMKSKKEMIRVLRTSENEIILDATEQLLLPFGNSGLQTIEKINI